MGKKRSKMYVVVDGKPNEKPEQVQTIGGKHYVLCDEPTDANVLAEGLKQSEVRPSEAVDNMKCSTQKNVNRKPERLLGWQRGYSRIA